VRIGREQAFRVKAIAVRPELLAPVRVASADTGAGKTAVAFKSVSGSYFDVLDIPIVRGRCGPMAAAWARHPARTDPVAYLASLGAIVASCLLAAWIPAARAAKVDPMRTLRQE
jgi:ABC-type antimicrobial peptide transport system permease subunit